MQAFDDTLLEPFVVDGIIVPLLRLTDADVPSVELQVGDQAYQYDRSYPVKGYSAVLPQYVLAQVGAGKKPLLIERPDRYYLYWAAATGATA